MYLISGISSFRGGGCRGLVLKVVVVGKDEVFLEISPGLFFCCFLAPFFTLAVEEAGVFDVLIPPSDELGIIDDFISSGGEFLSLLKLLE